MNVGVQYLREHMKPDARVHYAIIDGGGFSPNVVQPTASVLYMVRSTLVKDANALQERVDRIADGAALMTGTEYERVFIDGCSNTVTNHTLEKLLYDNMVALGAPEYTEAEWSFAKELRGTYEVHGLPGVAAQYDPVAKNTVEELCGDNTTPLYNFIAPYYSGYAHSPGSTDVGDVSWQTPTAQCNTLCFTAGAPGHSWQNVSVGKTSIGHKGLLFAGKVIASAAVDIFENEEYLKTAKAEFDIAAKGGYVSPIPDGEYAKPVEI